MYNGNMDTDRLHIALEDVRVKIHIYLVAYFCVRYLCCQFCTTPDAHHDPSLPLPRNKKTCIWKTIRGIGGKFGMSLSHVTTAICIDSVFLIVVC